MDLEIKKMRRYRRALLGRNKEGYGWRVWMMEDQRLVWAMLGFLLTKGRWLSRNGIEILIYLNFILEY